MRFDVFLEGAIDPSADGVDSVANAIANRYGISATDIKNKLAAGRVRIKANVDRATADGLAKDLLSLGGIATVVAAGGAAGNANSAKSSGGALSGVAARPQSSHQAASGLAAAGNFQSSSQDDFGALGSLSLNDEPTLSSSSSSLSKASFSPPGMTDFPEEEVAPVHQSTASAPAGNLDLFAPPDELAEAEPALVQEASPKAARATAYAEKQAGLDAQSTLSAAAAPASKRPGLLAPFVELRRRIAAAAVIAVLVGGVPAILIAGARESAAFKMLDARVALIQSEADTVEAWENLDVMRRNQAERKRAVQRNAAATALAMWVVVGGVAAYAWFRWMPWQRLASASSSVA